VNKHARRAARDSVQDRIREEWEEHLAHCVECGHDFTVANHVDEPEDYFPEDCPRCGPGTHLEIEVDS
jgi:ribosomal protein S27AE